MNSPRFREHEHTVWRFCLRWHVSRHHAYVELNWLRKPPTYIPRIGYVNLEYRILRLWLGE